VSGCEQAHLAEFCVTHFERDESVLANFHSVVKARKFFRRDVALKLPEVGTPNLVGYSGGRESGSDICASDLVGSRRIGRPWH
jgi:hypothetical protein